MKRPKVTRRQLLHGSLTAAAAIPLLESTRSHAQASEYPRRIVFFYTPNGTIRSEWRPRGSERDFTLGRILAPLEQFRDKLLILGGLNMPLAAVGPGSEHTRGIGGLLTGRPTLEGNFESAGQPNAGWASGISIDQQIARSLPAEAPFRSLELGVHVVDTEVRGRISYTGASQPLPPIENPYAAFDRLFAALPKPVSSEPDPALLRLHKNRQTVLSIVREQLDQTQALVGATDRLKLEAHLDSIRDIERRLVPEDGSSPSNPDQPSCELPDVGEPASLKADQDLPKAGQLQLDLLSGALACDLTRIATIQWTHAETNHTFPFLGISGAHHKISHAGDQELEEQERLIQINAWYGEQLAYFLERLAAYPEGDGTLLDNTVVVWCNEVGQGNNHSHSDLPFLLAGSCGGRLATGRFVDYQAGGAEGRPHNDLLVSLANVMDVELQTFGAEEHCTGPLSGLA
jgi:hypothetical protein